MQSCDYLHSTMKGNEGNYCIESRHLLGSRDSLTMFCSLILGNSTGNKVCIMRRLNFEFLHHLRKKNATIILAKKKKQKRKHRMTFFFFSDLFHHFRFAFFSSPASNFSCAAGICVNITSSATLGCNFLVFVVKMTRLLLRPGPTSADGGPSSHQRLTGCFGHYIHHKEMTPCILEKRLRRSAI